MMITNQTKTHKHISVLENNFVVALNENTWSKTMITTTTKNYNFTILIITRKSKLFYNSSFIN